jgi:hypothetical protein
MNSPLKKSFGWEMNSGVGSKCVKKSPMSAKILGKGLRAGAWIRVRAGGGRARRAEIG